MKKFTVYLAAGVIFGTIGFGSLNEMYYLDNKRHVDPKVEYTKQEVKYLSFINNKFKDVNGENNADTNITIESAQNSFEKIVENYFTPILTEDSLNVQVQSEFEKIKQKFPEFTKKDYSALESKQELNQAYDKNIDIYGSVAVLSLILAGISINKHGAKQRMRNSEDINYEFI